MDSRHERVVVLVAALSAATALVGACGATSKPSYCSSLAGLESSVKALPTTDVLHNGLNALQAAVNKVKSDAQPVANSAKSDFPNETSALEDSINALRSTVKQLASSPTPGTIAQLGADVRAVSSAVQNFANATSSKCG
jgi:hypothetical protein